MENYIPHGFIFAGIGIIAFLSFLAIRASRSSSWNAVPGVLLEKGTRLHVSRDIETGRMSWKSLHIDVEYSYEVEGAEYVSRRVTFSDMVNKPMSSLDGILNEYLASENVTVYYNPSKPSDSVLLPGVKLWNFTPMVTGLFSIAFGLFLLYQQG